MPDKNGKRGFAEIFSRYSPETAEHASLFEDAYDVTIRADKEKRFVEVAASFSRLFSKKIIYDLEARIASAYDLSSVRILPRYPSELFSESYIPEVITEAKRIGVIVNGFFNDYKLTVGDSVIEIKLPFLHGGIELLDLAKTGDVISGIIRSEFSLEYTVKISQSDDYESKYNEFMTSQAERIKAENAAALVNSAKAAEVKKHDAPAAKASPGEANSNLKHVQSLFDYPENVIYESDTVVSSGALKFDISEPKPVYGAPFAIADISTMRSLIEPKRNCVVIGTVVSVEAREMRKSDKLSLTVTVTDRDTSVYGKFVMGAIEADEIMSALGKGTPVAMRGNLKVDTYDGGLYLALGDIQTVKLIRRQDNAPEKRIELHMHSNLSTMDAVTEPETLVKTASKWGHEAVAITDHGNVQAFPRMMLAAQKAGNIKIIYGMEAYYVDDTARAVYGNSEYEFDEEFIVFDIETTGLSALNNKITEIGAVRIKDGEILEKFNTFANPGVHIPEEITRLTGITDDMVAGAPGQKEAVEAFLDFAGGKMLIAHNAGFDVSFIRKVSDDNGLKFENPYLDTVSMSRYVNPELSKHKLDVLADYFGLGDFNHHRASDDAEMLAYIYFKMTDKLKREGVANIGEMVRTMSEKSDPLRLKTYHQIILVKNLVGLKNLYKLISDSYLKYYRKHPRIPKTHLMEHREGLILGSACEAGELFTALLENRPESEIEEIANFYDYLEIQPICNNRFLVDNGKVADDEALRNLNRRIVALGKKLGKPVCATTDAHYLDPEDDIYRRILLTGLKFSDGDKESKLYFRTTDEMLAEFDYLGEETAREVVITNPKKISDMVENIRPIPEGNYPPNIEGAEEELTEKCHSLAKELYGDPLPEQVSSRLERELDSIIKNGFAIMYIIARKLVDNSESKGYQVGSRGSVGSSFVATMAGITRVNPLPPHYRCTKCKHCEFIDDGSVGSGFDLPAKNCPECGTEMYRDGHDIPFETFLGFYGDKTPDIDLNFSGDVQGEAHKFTEVLFGKGKAFKAGTIGTLASKTAFGFASKYTENKGVTLPRAELDRLIDGCVGVKRTTGQHPGGIIVVPKDKDIEDFSPVQHPADDPNSDIVTTHFEFKYLHDTILKLDILGHDIPTKYKRLEEYTNTSVIDVPMSDPKVYKLFTSTEPLGVTPEQIDSATGTLGLPEMGTRLSRNVLVEAQPKTFCDLLQIEGLTHGTGVWLGNADELIKDKVCTISDVIGCRDDIMMTLIHKYKIEKSLSFKIMEFVRKNKKGLPIPENMIAAMKENNVPEWYIDSLQKIRYMFPKAHAAAYAIDAIRLGWYKIYYPVEFYAAYFTAAPDGFDSEIVMGGPKHVKETMDAIKNMGKEASQKDAAIYDALTLVREYYARGYTFLPVSLKESHATKFLPENGKIRLPFTSLSGLGEAAALNIMETRDSREIYSVEDLTSNTKVSKSVIEILDRNGVFRGMSQTNQLSLF